MHEDYSGWFPYNLGDVTSWTDDERAKYGLVNFPLSTLSQIYWLAKSYDWNVDLAWTNSFRGESLVGTVTGMGTAQALSSSLGASPPFFGDKPPAQRAIASNYSVGEVLGRPVTNAGHSTGGGSTSPFSIMGYFYWSLFTGNLGYWPVNRNGDSFCTDVGSGGGGALAVFYGYASVYQALYANRFGSSVKSHATLAFTVGGVTIPPIPLWIENDGLTTLSGTITVNINSFWT